MYIKIKVKVGAKKELLKKIKEDLFHIEVKEPAKNNKANNQTCLVLSTYLRLPVGALRIISGHHSPSKIISVTFPEKK